MKRAIACILFLLLISCKPPSKEFTYEKEGVSFNCPAGWYISEEEPVEEGGYYLICEKKGWDQSGIITICWFTDSIDQLAWIEAYEGEMKKNIVFKNIGINFTQPYESSYRGSPTLCEDYTCSLLGVEMEGDIHVFYGCNKTFLVSSQQAIEDSLKNKNGFETIEKTFGCK